MSLSTKDFDTLLNDILDLVEIYQDAQEILFNGVRIRTPMDADDFYGDLLEEMKNSELFRNLKALKTGKILLTFKGRDEAEDWEMNFLIEGFRRVDSEDAVLWAITSERG
jgi:hypothetical protein